MIERLLDSDQLFGLIGTEGECIEAFSARLRFGMIRPPYSFRSLYVADSVSHFQADGGVLEGTELLADIAVIVGGGNCSHDRRIE